MSTVQLHCPRCAGLFQIDRSMAGRQVVCPLCGNLVAIPATVASEAALPGYGAPQVPTAPASGESHFGSAALVCPFCRGTFQLPLEMAGRQVACPLCGNLVAAPGEESRSDVTSRPPTVETRDPAPLPTEEGGFPAVQEPAETVVADEDEEERQGLTPKEKRQRRLVMSLIWAILGALVLIATATVMISLSD